MRIEINEFTTWPDNYKKLEEVREIVESGHYVVLILTRSDFSLTDLMRIRKEFKEEIIEEVLYLEESVREHKDGRASCRVELKKTNKEMEE